LVEKSRYLVTVSSSTGTSRAFMPILEDRQNGTIASRLRPVWTVSATSAATEHFKPD
jgi:hypothetical protein